jgi:hypothetical protein
MNESKVCTQGTTRRRAHYDFWIVIPASGIGVAPGPGRHICVENLHTVGAGFKADERVPAFTVSNGSEMPGTAAAVFPEMDRNTNKWRIDSRP